MDHLPNALKCWFVVHFVVESPAFRIPASYLLIGVFVAFTVVRVYWKKRLGDVRLSC